MSMRVGNLASAAGASARAALQDATESWKSALGEKLDTLTGEGGLGGYIGETAVSRIQNTVASAMEAFVRANPSAKLEDIKAKASELFTKAQGNELCAKMANDDFMGYLKRRMAEIQAQNAG